MNTRHNLVIIKGEDQTEQVSRISPTSERMAVTYTNGKTYLYARKNVERLSRPHRIPAEHHQVLVNGDILLDVDEILRFDTWVKIFHRNGNSRCHRFSELSLQQLPSSNGRNPDILAYCRELAQTAALRTDDGKSLLAMKYEHLEIVPGQSVLSSFLQARPPASDRFSSELIFPFGCNMSQKKAVQKAIENPVSLVQGPPGTGKTQTILNVIGNMLLLKKTVAVVSNNNSATANVLEKLQKYELDFMTATLGSNKNKKAFIESQTPETVLMPTLEPKEKASVRKRIRHLNKELDEAFEKKNELADIIQQIDALRLEQAHFERFSEETQQDDRKTPNRTFHPRVAAEKLLKAWISYEESVKRRKKTQGQSRGFLEKIDLLLRFGKAGKTLSGLSIEERIPLLQKAYYVRKLAEMEKRRKTLEASLEGFHFEERLKQLTDLSMLLLKHHLGKQYNARKRKKFKFHDLSNRPEAFLKDYPVVLSTTFSIITSLRPGYVFDCVIVDEASQVDLLSGILAMGCAKKLVIVGDPMQLPNVITEKDEQRAQHIALQYELPDYARFERHSLLSAVRAAFPGIPETLLREHYRCHPKIIQFCNQKFYGGELLVMTRDHGEEDVLKAFLTVEGRHARGTFNQRQIDEITQHVLPELTSTEPADIGIVSPFREQKTRMQGAVGAKEIEVDTIHQYQGREKRAIIITTVSNEANEFVDNPNLLNVAVSRAQEKLRLVVSKEMAAGKGNVADLVGYIRHNNCEVVPGRVRSVFDLLYHDYTALRKKVFNKRKRISKYDSENLASHLIESILQEENYREFGVIFQFPLSMLVRDTGNLTAEEHGYATHPWTRTDFIIYRKVDKSPALAIEVDGYAFHREGTPQAGRDALKDAVLAKCAIPLLRLSTVESDERSRIRSKLQEIRNR
ncbi:AAA family ATPase [Prosthecochloris sp. N3]|uniref:AAA family ATPase n=1 Tax=Prosthecochloris ethylica TaxID=2743976 RepID=A0ABR9XR81_9CHLB|nr:AAA domain-containing protein [Prosthecochloris ethylica]MBF0586048.1 AAA family ATPase [Prosthecochloris ethylica]MBF0636552.1 AAA family ATPase [Prosthecochloris ethylica]MEC9487822.1 AAA domain-containing protein [Prosthecochloris sp.]NUK47184.1 AAA family ATPase [Prosthecochloris ethylica]